MKIDRQVIFRNKVTNKLRVIHNVHFILEYSDYFRIFVHSKSWRSDLRSIRLYRHEWEFVEMKDVELCEKIRSRSRRK